MYTIILMAVTRQLATNYSWEYVIGALIALWILAYLLFTLTNPEKF